MNKTEQSRKSYNKQARYYENTHDGRVTRPLKQMLLGVIDVRSGQTVVDVACGPGDLIAAISKRAKVQAFGIDIAERMIEVAKETYRGISFIAAPAVPLPFENTSVDIIVVSAAFHHFEEPQRFADECARVLRAGGLVYIGEFHVPPAARRIMNALLPIVRTGDVRLYSDTELIEFFTKAGFDAQVILTDGPRIVIKCTKI